MKIELMQDDYEKIDRAILEIENAAYSGIFTNLNAASLFQKIVSDTKTLRRTLRDVLPLVPDGRRAAHDGEGGAA